MEKDALGLKILELYTRNEMELLKEAVMTALGTLRGKTLDSLERFLESAEGKLRMAILEILIKDGGADLIPLFINCIRKEKNALYTKSQILLFKEFRHQSALGALLSIESEIDVELKGTYQRTLGRLLSQFSEQFYMSEFLAGIGDPRRVHFAADMMLRSPHTDYLPFLADRVQENDYGYRSAGVRVLQELGNGPSNDALFSMLSRLRRQFRKAEELNQALHAPRGDLFAFFQDLVKAAGLNWPEAQAMSYFTAIGAGEGEDPLSQIFDNFQVVGEVRKKVKPFLKGLLCGGEPSAFQISRARSAMDEYLQEMGSLQLQAVRSMGEIADRTNDGNFLKRMDQFLSADDSRRDELLISSLAGYRREASRDLLVEYVNTCSEPEILGQALKALEAFPQEVVPRGVEKLCFDEHHGVLRKKAVDLVAHWGQGAPLAKALMESNSLAVCADGVRIVAEYRLQDGYATLLGLLKKQIPDSLLVNVLEALASFPCVTTGRALKAFLLPPHTLTVRKAALATCFRAGGEERLDMMVRTLAQFQSKGDELIDNFLSLMLTEEFEDREHFLLGEREFWLRLLAPEYEALWPKVLQLLESLPIEGPHQARPWLSGLKKVTATFATAEPTVLQRRILALAQALEGAVVNLSAQERGTKLLQSLLDGLDVPNPFQRTQAMRNMVRNFPEEVVFANEDAHERIMAFVLDQLAQKDAPKDSLLQAIALAGKLRHPKVFAKLRPFLEYPNIDVRSAVRVVLEESVHAKFSKPLQTVFIMDDSRYITKQLGKVLTQAQFSVDFENDTELGIRRLSERKYDLLLLDVLMPQKSGAAFLKEARQKGVAPGYTLVITASRSREDLSPLLSLGVDGVLLKPFRMEELLTRIKDLVQI